MLLWGQPASGPAGPMAQDLGNSWKENISEKNSDHIECIFPCHYAPKQNKVQTIFIAYIYIAYIYIFIANYFYIHIYI